MKCVGYEGAWLKGSVIDYPTWQDERKAADEEKANANREPSRSGKRQEVLVKGNKTGS